MFRSLIGILVLTLTFNAGAKGPQFENFKLTSQFKVNHHPSPNKLPPVIDELWQRVKSQGYKAVNSALKRILNYRDRYPLGQYNFPEASWNTGIDGKVEVAFIRRLEPMLHTKAWRVMDRVILGIGAEAYLRNLRDEGSIEISDSQLSLFAGIFFKREYSFEHTAATYLEGLKQKIDHLLLSFKKFNGLNFLDLKEDEMISKDDYLSAEIGMSVNSPSIYWMSVRGNATVYFSKLNSLSYHNQYDPQSGHHSLKMAYQKMKVKGTRAQIGLQIDFYKLLKLSLLGTEYSASITKSRISTYQFDPEQIERIRQDELLATAFKKVNQGKDPEKLAELAGYKSSVEDSIRLQENLSAYALMWGKIWGNMTEGIIFQNYGQNRFLYRHQQERVAFDRGILDTIFRSDNLSTYKSREIENMLFEYESPIEESGFENIKLAMPALVSFRLSKEFAAKRDRSRDRKKVTELMSTFTNIDRGVIDGIGSGKIKAPFFLDLHAQVSKKGIYHLFQFTPFQLNRIYGHICAGDWIQGTPGKRVRKCIQKLTRLFRPVREAYFFENKLALNPLKAFFSVISQKIKSFYILKELFGSDHVQLYGTFRGKTEENMSFRTYVKQGPYQGLGVVKDVVLGN